MTSHCRSSLRSNALSRAWRRLGLNLIIFHFYHAMRRRARYCHVVCPSVTLVDFDRISWYSSKIRPISRLVSMLCSLSIYISQHHGSTPNGTSRHLVGIGVGCGKTRGFWRTKPLISLKCCKIAARLLLRTNRNGKFILATA